MWVNLVTKHATLNIRVSKIEIDKEKLRLGDYQKDISNACFHLDDIVSLNVREDGK